MKLKSRFVVEIALMILWSAFFASVPCLAESEGRLFTAQGSDPNRPPSAQRPAKNGGANSAAAASKDKASDAQPTGAEKELFDHVNESRVLSGVSALRWDEVLAAAARQHCALLVQHDSLSHQFPGEPDLKQRLNDAGAAFSGAAENVAVAATPEEIHYEWMHSPPHRANILDPNLTAIGIATQQGSKGLYAVQDFSHSVEQLTLTEQEEKVRALIEAMGVHTADNPARTNWSDARRTCDTPSGFAGKPASVTRFETSDLGELPSKLKTLLASRSYHTAAVGACAPANHGGASSQYRLVVLLY